MKEIDNLMERCKRALKSAKLLLEDKDFDSVVSRAYYAMFYAAEAILFSKGFIFHSHKAVISQFGEHFVKTGIFSKELGRKLSKTYGKRLKGDYEFAFVFSEEEANDIVKWAIDFADSIEDYLMKEGIIKK